MKIIFVLIIGIIPFCLSAKNVKVTIITIDSLTGENLKNHYVYIDDYNLVLSIKDSNVSTFTLNTEDKNIYEIRVCTFFYLESKFKLILPSNSNDTTIIVKLMYSFPPRTLPIFFYNKNDYKPDTTNLEKEKERLTALLHHTLNDPRLILQLDCYSYIDENDTNNVLSIKRANYIRDFLIDMGFDSNKIDIRLCGYKPYKIFAKEEMTDYLKFKDVLDQAFIEKLPESVKYKVENYNRRIEITIRSE
jgi:hypothetical protein